MIRKKIRIGDLLVEQKLISQAQLEDALADQKKTGRKLGRILIEHGYVAENLILEVLSRQLNIPFVDLLHYKFKPEVIKLLPEVQARRFRAIALARSEDSLMVGMADPTDIFGFDELSRILQLPLRLAVVRESDLLSTLDNVYRKTDEITEFAGRLSTELHASDVDLQALVSDADVSDAPVVKLLQSVFEDAVQVNASDIHIEPEEKMVRIRLRVDGILQEQVVDEANIAAAVVSRLKLIAGLDISEKRLPQDGRFTVNVKAHNVDVRISTMPMQNGESVVMRLLDQTRGTFELEELGMPPRIRSAYEHVLKHPHGMVLVTGPTGSGKTTTLYAGLRLLNTPETKIITVEDPVEYRLSRVNQVQVNADIGLTFSRVLRSALRQDPDIVLVGEIRDEETAEIAVRAAMTGHLVLSTLHTNNAISTINRLLDMNIRSYLLASALNAVIAQRLVRRVCIGCAQDTVIGAEKMAYIRAIGGDQAAWNGFKRGIGCSRCNFTGYHGRVGIYELLLIDHELARILGRGDSNEFTDAAAKSPGYFTLAQAALEAATNGITTIEEVMRITAEVDTDTPAESRAVNGILEVPDRPQETH
ncbi:MAG: type II/IV secretion system protein [Gammaproteobacteria bacterium]|jgi:MSHA biogenesis protein MshE|nr:MAG: type II/IV secretion system protein [Gammaproteobacteria bacterium]